MASNQVGTGFNLPLLFGVLGGLLLGEGVLLFISSNWRMIPDGAKLVLVFANFLVAYALAYRMKFGTSPKPGLASGLFLKGAIGYGAGLFLIGQIYNFHSDWRAGILYWFLGALPLAYVVESLPVLMLSLSTLILWLISAFGFFEAEVFLLLPLLGAILTLVAVFHRQQQYFARFAGSYLMVGVCLILIPTLLLTWDDFVRNQLILQPTGEFWNYFWTLTGLYTLLLVATGAYFHASANLAIRWLVILLTVTLVPVFFMAAGAEDAPKESTDFLLCTNLLFFCECLGLIRLGAAWRSGALVKLGLALFGVLAAWRFFDEYWYYLPRSIVFTLLGILLLAWAFWLERNRRSKIAASTQEADS
jgi:uncharacterized membrane protein